MGDLTANDGFTTLTVASAPFAGVYHGLRVEVAGVPGVNVVVSHTCSALTIYRAKPSPLGWWYPGRWA